MTQDRKPDGEVWWIYSPEYGLRIAHFGKVRDYDSKSDIETFFILGDTVDRTGIRIWEHVSQREGWAKVQQIPIPTNYN